MYPLSLASSPFADSILQNGRYVHRSIADVPHMDPVKSHLIDVFIRTERPYLWQGYTLIDMSKDLGIPLHILSRMINRWYGMNFNTIINKFRIEYMKDIPTHEPFQLFHACGPARPQLRHGNGRPLALTATATSPKSRVFSRPGRTCP